MDVRTEWIPRPLIERDQWVMWRVSDERKVPLQPDGRPASSTNPQTWSSFSAVVDSDLRARGLGLGFVFSPDDPLVGIDLDGCRRPDGSLAPWAKEIVTQVGSYTEISPSEAGLKIWCESSRISGRKVELPDPWTPEKGPGIEIYHNSRYFTVTGHRLQGFSSVRPAKLAWLVKKYWPERDQAAERAMAYLATMDPAISGQGGHNRCFRAACALVCGFGLDLEKAYQLLLEAYNPRCRPPWSEKELRHKVDDADRQAGPRGFLVGLSPSQWDKVRLPDFKRPPRQTTLAQATRKYAAVVKQGEEVLQETGLPEVDYAVGGGIAPGELVVLAARPSHGKSAVALQVIHHTTITRPVLLVSEEMSAMALGKRSLQYLSTLPEEHWQTAHQKVTQDIDTHFGHRKPCIVLESCGDINTVVQQIEVARMKWQVQVVVVDYMQLLNAQGRGRYEQVTNVSRGLRQAANQNGVTIWMLAQLSRAVELRPHFQPCLSDLKESGQIEQDADVILFLVWPHRVNPDKHDPKKFQVFVGKNRNRAVKTEKIEVEFDPRRQSIHTPGVSQWNVCESF